MTGCVNGYKLVSEVSCEQCQEGKLCFENATGFFELNCTKETGDIRECGLGLIKSCKFGKSLSPDKLSCLGCLDDYVCNGITSEYCSLNQLNMISCEKGLVTRCSPGFLISE